MRLVWIFFLLLAGVNAGTLEAKYKVEFGIFGKVGESRASISRNNGRYKISIRAEAAGLARTLSGGRVEIYTSEGEIVDGMLVPEIYKKDIQTSRKGRIKIYTFDHEHRKVTTYQERFKNGKKSSSEHAELPYYAKNDVLSLYFNLKRLMPGCKPGETRRFSAVGAHKEDGRVDVAVLKGKARERAEDFLEAKGCIMLVTIHQDLFGSQGGKLYLALDDKGITRKSVLKDVVIFGDIRGRLVESRYTPQD